MGEVLLMLLTGGGSTAMGAILKGIFGFVFESKRQKHELEIAREVRANDNFIGLQNCLAENGNSEFTSFTRRVCAWMGVSTLCCAILMCTAFPTMEWSSVSNATGEGRTEWFFGLLSYPAPQEPITLSMGHLSYMGQTALCGILGFYFGPSPRG
jgi:hypothetical protein